MMRLFSILSVISVAAASIVDCGSTWPVIFTVDPPATVGAGQNVSMTAVFEVPLILRDEDRLTPAPLTEGLITVHGSLSYVIDMEFSYAMCNYLPCPLTAGTYNWTWTEPLPEGVVGRVQTTLMLKGLVAKKPWLCLRWTAFATGSASNKTNAAIRWLYS